MLQQYEWAVRDADLEAAVWRCGSGVRTVYKRLHVQERRLRELPFELSERLLLWTELPIGDVQQRVRHPGERVPGVRDRDGLLCHARVPVATALGRASRV
jgi:hypothetical protein